MTRLFSILLIVLIAVSATAHDYVPGEPQTHPILLKGGTVFTITDGVLENTDVLFENGVITAIAVGIEPTEDTEVIDITGHHVYPGLIALGTSLGLIEIGAVRATNDRGEVGAINPDVLASVAYNPDSEIIPTVRSNGIAYAQVVPNGSMLAGRSCVMNLDAWTREDGGLVLDGGLHVNIPGMSTRARWYDRRTDKEREEALERNLKQLEQAFDDAEAYRIAREAELPIGIDSRWEAMMPVLAGTKPVFVHADDYRQIEYALDFTEERELKMVLVGGKEAWKMAERLAERKIPVVYTDAAGLPQRLDDPYDQAFRACALLHEAGVDVSFESGGATGVRNLPFVAGMAAAWGLPKEAALRGLTIVPAQILGVDDEIGSIEVGKRASLIVSEGDVMDHLTHGVTHMFIDGRRVNLDSKHKELYRKYRARYAD